MLVAIFNRRRGGNNVCQLFRSRQRLFPVTLYNGAGDTLSETLFTKGFSALSDVFFFRL